MPAVSYYPFTTAGAFKIPYAESVEGYREFAENGHSASERVLQCQWKDRRAFRQDLLGWATVSSSGLLHRELPEKHPEYQELDGDPTLTQYCVSAELVRCLGIPIKDSDTGLIHFYDGDPHDIGVIDIDRTEGIAEFRTRWEFLPYDIVEDKDLPSVGTLILPAEYQRYTKLTWTYASDTLPIPGNTFFYAIGSTAAPIPTPKAILQPTREYTYEWHNVPTLNFLPIKALSDNIDKCEGRVNNVVFDSKPVGTMLFLTANLEPTRLANDDFALTITYKLLYRKTGWNNFYRASTHSFVEATSTGNAAGYPASDGVHPYNDEDLNRLFQFSTT